MSAPTPSAEPVAPQFRPDQAAFMARLATGEAKDRETAHVVKANLMAMGPRIGQALALLKSDKPNLGSVRSYLEIGLRDYQAALKALPEL